MPDEWLSCDTGLPPFFFLAAVAAVAVTAGAEATAARLLRLKGRRYVAVAWPMPEPVGCRQRVAFKSGVSVRPSLT